MMLCNPSFFSRNSQPPQSRYSTFGRELLAIYLATKHFRHILEGRNLQWSQTPIYIAASNSDLYSQEKLDLSTTPSTALPISGMWKNLIILWRMLCRFQVCITCLCQPHSVGSASQRHRRRIRNPIPTDHRHHPHWCSKICPYLLEMASLFVTSPPEKPDCLSLTWRAT